MLHSALHLRGLARTVEPNYRTRGLGPIPAVLLRRGTKIKIRDYFSFGRLPRPWWFLIGRSNLFSAWHCFEVSGHPC